LAPVYSRLYTPADYGVFSVYNAIVATALTVGSLCYETGIPIGEDDREAIGLTTIAVLVVVMTAVGAITWLGIGALFASGGPHYQLGLYLWLVPIGIVGGGVNRTVRYWALRKKEMNAIARSAVSQLVGSNAITLGCGVLSPSPLALMVAGIVGTSAGTWSLARRTGLVPRLRAQRVEGLVSMRLWTIAKKYRRLALVSGPSTLFNSLGLYLPSLLFLPYFGADFAGQYFMGLKIVGLPVALIGGVMGQVFLSRVAEIARKQPQNLARYFRRAHMIGTACSLPVLAVGLAAPWAIPVALGSKWRVAGEITLWLSLYNVVGLSVSALSYIPNIVGRLHGQLAIDVSRATALGLLILAGHQLGLSGMAVVKGYVLLMIGNYLVCYWLYSHQVSVVSRTGVTAWE
jgi:O-antigen/teichoic acid export membrane protein